MRCGNQIPPAETLSHRSPEVGGLASPHARGHAVHFPCRTLHDALVSTIDEEGIADQMGEV
jgi:hypothetical protein